MAKSFTFFWKNGKREVLTGNGPSFALIRAGYSPLQKISGIDFYLEGEKEEEYQWSEKDKKWIYNERKNK